MLQLLSLATSCCCCHHHRPKSLSAAVAVTVTVVVAIAVVAAAAVASSLQLDLLQHHRFVVVAAFTTFASSLSSLLPSLPFYRCRVIDTVPICGVAVTFFASFPLSPSPSPACHRFRRCSAVPLSRHRCRRCHRCCHHRHHHRFIVVANVAVSFQSSLLMLLSPSPLSQHV